MSISRRKIAKTEDFLKLLSDQIREEKMGGRTDSDAAKILGFVRLFPETVYVTDQIFSNLGLNSLEETVTPDAVSISYTETNGSFSIVRGNNASLNNITFASGKYRNGLEYNGTSSFTSIADQTELREIDEVTAECWFKINTAQQGALIAKDGSYFLALNGAGNKLYAGVNVSNAGEGGAFDIGAFDSGFDQGTQTWQYLTGGTTLSTATWYHGAVVYDGSNVSLYLNGAKDATDVAVSGIVTDSSNPTKTGYGDSIAPWYFAGVIDNARVYNNGLTTTQVSNIYNAVVTRNGLIVELSMNESSGSSATNTAGSRIGYSEIS